ncbi:class I SAM-dependent DNA methyltransferase [Azovibrio restrictus]|uniref:type I restriction-modification system subunit M n=1 Tax=Azovibrio restrictus TaxID=146938 RepID=UPI0026EFC33D|nr:class I SAM-dependent DNA methyltransferase [Azovibrio restrictus]MDD3483425.1 class I SAM-dependent DNA methyltransferase [Azovibrio restrictus]
MSKSHELSNFIWSIADLLRGPYRPPQYERVMLPLVVLRRFDCVLESTKDAVLAKYAQYQGKHEGVALDSVLNKVSGQRFHNHSPLSFKKLMGDPDNAHLHLVSYINGFSENVRKIFERFDFGNEIERMREHNILFLVIKKFCEVDLHPGAVDNIEMGLLFEDLIRRFNEQANETAGDHFTPREVIRLMVNLLFMHDDDLLSKPGTVRKMLDPTCGTGGMLSEARKYLREHQAGARLFVYGQDFNPRSYAVAASDLLLRTNPDDAETSTIKFGDTLIDDQFPGERFDYFLANPPFGVDWKRQQKQVVREHESGEKGRFNAGVPRVNDGALLFLQHMLSKFEPVDPARNLDGSRLAIVFNGSPLFTGGAGSGESEIRKWIIENDWLEAIVAMPEQMFYNTGIGTYIWVVTNRKEVRRRGKIQLIDGRDRWQSLRRSLGDKRREFSDAHITDIVREYGDMRDNATSKVFDNADFGYRRLTIERPLRLAFQITLERKERFLDACPELLDDLQAIDKAIGRAASRDWNAIWKQAQAILKERDSKWRAPQVKAFREAFTEIDPQAEAVIAKKVGGKIEYEANPKLRDFENVPLKEDVHAYFEREVRPHVADAWIDHEKTKLGYEINFNRHFYRFTPPRPLSEIDADLKRAEEEIIRLLREVTAETRA